MSTAAPDRSVPAKATIAHDFRVRVIAQRSSLINSIAMLAQDSCDFSRALQVGDDSDSVDRAMRPGAV